MDACFYNNGEKSLHTGISVERLSSVKNLAERWILKFKTFYVIFVLPKISEKI